MRPRLRPPEQICDDAEFDGKTHRLWLSRKVSDEAKPVGLIIGLNPSTAGATEDDHTIRKEKEFARRWGWQGFWKLNLFTIIETNSRKLADFDYHMAIGAYGSAVLETFIPRAWSIVVCWGAAVPKHMQHRIPAVCTHIRHLKAAGTMVFCFGTSKGGHPKHPLMFGYDTKIEPFELPDLSPRPTIKDDE